MLNKLRNIFSKKEEESEVKDEEGRVVGVKTEKSYDDDNVIDEITSEDGEVAEESVEGGERCEEVEDPSEDGEDEEEDVGEGEKVEEDTEKVGDDEDDDEDDVDMSEAIDDEFSYTCPKCGRKARVVITSGGKFYVCPNCNRVCKRD